MAHVVIKESARTNVKLTERKITAAVRHAVKSTSTKGTTKVGIDFNKIKNTIYLF